MHLQVKAIIEQLVKKLLGYFNSNFNLIAITIKEMMIIIAIAIKTAIIIITRVAIVVAKIIIAIVIIEMEPVIIWITKSQEGASFILSWLQYC